MATAAIREQDGTVVAEYRCLMCGDTMEQCFAVEQSGITSASAPALSAAVFHLFQTYEDAEDVVHALKSCATDIGEPGVDREFGQGLVDFRCAEAHAVGLSIGDFGWCGMRILLAKLLAIVMSAPMPCRPGAGLLDASDAWHVGFLKFPNGGWRNGIAVKPRTIGVVIGDVRIVRSRFTRSLPRQFVAIRIGLDVPDALSAPQGLRCSDSRTYFGSSRRGPNRSMARALSPAAARRRNGPDRPIWFSLPAFSISNNCSSRRRVLPAHHPFLNA